MKVYVYQSCPFDRMLEGVTNRSWRSKRLPPIGEKDTLCNVRDFPPSPVGPPIVSFSVFVP